MKNGAAVIAFPGRKGPQAHTRMLVRHGYGVLLRIEQISGGALLVQQGALYQALARLEHRGLLDFEWGTSENNRTAKYYRLPGLC